MRILFLLLTLSFTNYYPPLANYIYGIDFGTSNSVVAILDIQKKEIVKTNSENSIIYFKDAKDLFIGNEAVHKYLENNLHGRLVKSVKTLLPQANFSFTYIFGKKYTPEDLVALILKFLKKQADSFTGEDVKEVVLGRPVVFSEDLDKDKLAEKRLLSAAKLAGFEKIWFQYEPIAAGFLYEQTIETPETVLIGDFGGGTSDFTLMKLDKNNLTVKDRKADIIKTGGVHIGGDDIDSLIMWNKLVTYFGYGLKYDSFGKSLDLPVHIFRTLCEWEQMAFLKEGNIRRSLNDYYYHTKNNPALKRLMTLIDNNLGFSLFQAIESSKKDLSTKESSVITYHQQEIDIEETIQFSEFNEFIQPDISKIDQYLEDFIQNTKTGLPEINNVFLTGGTSSIRSVKDIFRKNFTDERIQTLDNFTSVAQGLALSYYYLCSFDPR